MESTENVKEKLNSLLQKKICDQQERDQKDLILKEELSADNFIGVQIKQELDFIADNNSPPPADDKQQAEHMVSDDLLNQASLHQILSLKKKALLQNKEIIDFLRNRIKPD